MLLEQGVQSVALESTGVYWIPVHEVLEDQGLEVLLGVLRELSSSGYETAPGVHYSGFLAIIDHPTRALGTCGAHSVESLNR